MSDVFTLRRGVAMSTLFFGHHQSFPLDREGESSDGPDGAGVTPVTWLPARGREDAQDEVDSTRGY